MLSHFETDDAKLWAVFWCSFAAAVSVISISISTYHSIRWLNPGPSEPAQYILRIEPAK